MKRQSSKHDASAELLRQRILITLDFFGAIEDLGATARELREGAQSAFARGDVRTLRLLANDIDSLAVALNPQQRHELEGLLIARLGIDRNAERLELARHIAATVKRGKIASEKERRRLETYLDLLEALGGDPAEKAAVLKLLQNG